MDPRPAHLTGSWIWPDVTEPVHPNIARAYADAGGQGVPAAVRLTGRPLRSASYDGPPPAVEPTDVTWPEGKFKVFPDRTEYQYQATVPDASLTALYAWAAKAAEERMILEDLTAILRERPAGSPGVILLDQEDTLVLKESSWIPSGTVIYSRLGQPDLMVKVDPDGPGVLYYRQRS